MADALVPKPKVPLHQSIDHILNLIGEPSSAERKVLRAIVEEADIIEIVPGLPFILAPVTPEIIDILAAFEAEHGEIADAEFDFPFGSDDGEAGDKEDAEIDDEDRCSAGDDVGRGDPLPDLYPVWPGLDP